MQYVVISRFDADAVARLRNELPPTAFAYIDDAIHHQRLPNQADVEAQGVPPGLASVLAAFGTLVTPVRFDLARGTAGGIDWDAAAATYTEMATEASELSISSHHTSSRPATRAMPASSSTLGIRIAAVPKGSPATSIS